MRNSHVSEVAVSRTDALVAFLARMLIQWRGRLGILFLALTVGFAVSALQTRLDPGFNKLIPLKHPYMAAFLQHASTFSGANRVIVSASWKGEGDIYNAEFLDALRKLTDEVFFTPGINRAGVRSLFTPNVRYIEVTEFGFNGDVVIPSRFVPDETGLAAIRANVVKSGEIGRLVANDLKSAMVQADLLEINPQTGEKLDYADVARRLEEVRAKIGNDKIDIQIIGFAKLIGDVMDALFTVVTFFAVAFAITFGLLWAYSRSLKLTVLAIVVALLPVIWLLGILPLIGTGIDPMSVLVPFLIFSIGVSHAVQMTNAWKQEVLAGQTAVDAAEAAFRKLAIPGTMALLANALGFLVIMLIDIPIVHELGLTACLGVALMIVTNKMFLPIILCHLHLEEGALVQKHPAATHRHPQWWRLSALATPRPALISLLVMSLLLAVGTYYSRQLQTGDIGSGVPELRPESRYNMDNAQIIKNYSIGMDVLSVYVETENLEEACLNWEVMNAIERFDMHMRGMAGVRSVTTVAGKAKLFVAGNNEANPRWAALQRTESALRTGGRAANPDLGLNTTGCKTIHLIVFLTDHQGATLKHVVDEVQHFIDNNPVANARFRLAGGNAGVAEATNQAVERAEVQMLASIFAAITLLCWVTFRSWRAVLCVIVPLALVTIMCNALMAVLGIGLKVATLPVIALGAGVGVDYGIYIYERMQHEMAMGQSLREAFYDAMRQRGTAAVFTAVTMSIGVGTWAFSALKFQADMGILLGFMFLVNVLGAILLLPALAVWLGIGEKRA